MDACGSFFGFAWSSKSRLFTADPIAALGQSPQHFGHGFDGLNGLIGELGERRAKRPQAFKPRPSEWVVSLRMVGGAAWYI